ncbi:MAG: hypothetical protein KDD36_08100 [Flavobacteriales bacterium]|nr:hypothetical protein [Flavobacteriales bacterium]
MIQFFRSGRPQSLILLPVLAMILYIGGMLTHATASPSGGPLYQLLMLISGGFDWVQMVFAVTLITLGAILLNKVATDHLFDARNTFLPGLMYVLLSSSLAPFVHLSPTQPANLLMILALDKILSFNRKGNIYPLVLDAGMLVGVAALFYPSYIIFLLTVWIGLNHFRPFAWREWLIVWIGCAIPIAIIWVFYFATELSFHAWHLPGKSEKLRVPMSTSWLLWSITAILAVWAMINTLLQYPKRNLRSKKNITLLLLMLCNAVILIASQWEPQILYTSALMLGILFANFISNVKPVYAQLVLLILLSALIQNQLIFLLN